jgi:hypothetical protein
MKIVKVKQKHINLKIIGSIMHEVFGMPNLRPMYFEFVGSIPVHDNEIYLRIS